ncbi:MAG TPA: LrgB family protein [Burkholderiales bacterium]|nr:LrgB family protein [Burkholderiales bacterium]
MMGARLNDIWVYLSTTPLIGLTLTLVAYQAAYWLYQRANFHPLLNPVAVTVALIVTALLLTHTPYQTYFSGAQFIHFLLGPATVALAIPLYGQIDKLKRAWRGVLLALICGSATAAGSAVLIAWMLGATATTLKSLAPKSVTTPIAMGIAEKIGGLPSLTAVLVMCTGIIGAGLGKYILDALRIRDHAARGFAVGVAAHGIGTARAFQLSEEAGAFSGLGMGLNAVLTALIVPLAQWALSAL